MIDRLANERSGSVAESGRSTRFITCSAGIRVAHSGPRGISSPGYLVLVVLAAMAGCAGRQPLIAPEVNSGGLPVAVELERTPFFPQADYQCGPAALATVLGASGVEVTAEELTEKVYIPERRGSLQIELEAAARSLGRLSYVIDPDLGSLLGELSAGRPVLVFQNLGPGFAPVWHYAVVIGYDASEETFTLRSGTTKRQLLTADAFARTWAAGEYWAIVVLRPGELPVNGDRVRYLKAATALERAGRGGAALTALKAATEHWPQSASTHFALANAYRAIGDSLQAERSYRLALTVEPGDVAAMNNLARLLLEQNRCDEARETMRPAMIAPAANPGLQGAVESTNEAIRRLCTVD